MPVYKYKTFEEAERALWNFHPDEAYFRKVAELWNFANKLLPVSYSKGIFKFRSMEEANKHRDQCELEHAGKIQDGRCPSSGLLPNPDKPERIATKAPRHKQ
jgi:hypothetical protein